MSTATIIDTYLRDPARQWPERRAQVFYLRNLSTPWWIQCPPANACAIVLRSGTPVPVAPLWGLRLN